MSKFGSYLYGVKKSFPVFFGFLPVAITFAIMAAGAGLTGAETIAMSVFVFAGASQIMAVGMIGAGASAFSIILATFVLNLRHVIMSTCVFKRVRVRSFFLRLVGAMSVTDEGFAVITTEDEERCTVSFMLGVITLIYSSWVIGTAVGVVASNVLPRIFADSFGIALYALFIALITPDIKKSLRLFITVAITAAINICLFFFLDSSWAIIIATLLGAFIGTFIAPDEDSEEVSER